jgi:3-phenylpropionate/trans-cinnamate dioxygenase ferredoxin reductase subunit
VPSDRDTFAIVGAGLAGAKAAEALRSQGFAGRIVLFGDERERPYERPPLSKEYLQGASDRESVFVHPAGWYAEHGVDLRLGVPVARVDPAAHAVVTADSVRLRYERLLIATGSSPRRLGIPGADLDGVRYLRRLDDADALKFALAAASRVAIIGAGWIGLETAAAARAAGAEVSVLEMAPLPLVGVLGPDIAGAYADLHRTHGVDLRLRVQVEAILGDGRRATGVRLADGAEIAADVVIVGIGITPNTGLAEGAGLTVVNGVLVDEYLTTSDPDIFAAGDVANAYYPHLATHVRLEHWAAALDQGPVAAANMAGTPTVYDRVPYFYSDQYEWGMEYSGYVPGGKADDLVIRGDLRAGRFIAFWMTDGRVRAGMNVNIWDVTEPIQALVRSGHPVDPAALADPDVPLGLLLPPK